MSENSENNWNREMFTGLVLAVFAALMAISDLFAGKNGGDEVKAVNEKASAFMWYQSKSIRQNIAEGQEDLIETLMTAGVFKTEMNASIQKHLDSLKGKINKYDREKKEILLGSQTIGQENWAQEVDGKLGQVIGAKEWENEVNLRGEAGDRFDLASLFFQICLVLGAISLVIKKENLQKLFFGLMIGCGLVATSVSAWAFSIFLKI